MILKVLKYFLRSARPLNKQNEFKLIINHRINILSTTIKNTLPLINDFVSKKIR